MNSPPRQTANKLVRRRYEKIALAAVVLDLAAMAGIASIFKHEVAAAFRKSESGAAAVEFGLIATILVNILFGAIEFSLIFFTYNTSENAARDVARQLATNRLASSQAIDTIKAQLPRWAAENANITISQSTPTVPSTNLFTVNVAIPAKKASPSNMLAWAYETITLNARVTIQQEGVP